MAESLNKVKSVLLLERVSHNILTPTQQHPNITFVNGGFMVLPIGTSVNSFLNANISNKRINKMFENNECPHMSLWEKIKEFFFATGEREALDCLFKLCNPTPNMTIKKIQDTFFRLKELCAPGYKGRFSHDQVDNSSTKDLHINGKDGDKLLHININEQTCSYNILGKEFIFEASLPFELSPEDKTRLPGLSISRQVIKSQSHIKCDEWLNNFFYHVSYNNNDFHLDYKKFYNDVLKEISSVNNGTQFKWWKREEKVVYISSTINREIDIQCIEKSTNLSKKDREDIFRRVKNKLSECKLTLNSDCAQSSIKHTVLSLINTHRSFPEFIRNVSPDRQVKNVLTTALVNTLSNHIFEDLFMTKMKLPREWMSIIRQSVSGSLPSSPSESGEPDATIVDQA